MNANELADEVMEHYRAMLPRGFNVNWMQEAATMLRQQQAEIDNLAIVKYLNGVTISKLYAEIEALKEPKIPLLDQEIKFILGNGQCWQGEDCSMPNLMYIIRAVEAAHGIGVKQDE